MTHSPIQKMKKAEAMKESIHHHRNMNVVGVKQGGGNTNMNKMDSQAGKMGNTPMDMPTQEGMNE